MAHIFSFFLFFWKQKSVITYLKSPGLRQRKCYVVHPGTFSALEHTDRFGTHLLVQVTWRILVCICGMSVRAQIFFMHGGTVHSQQEVPGKTIWGLLCGACKFCLWISSHHLKTCSEHRCWDLFHWYNQSNDKSEMFYTAGLTLLERAYARSSIRLHLRLFNIVRRL